MNKNQEYFFTYIERPTADLDSWPNWLGPLIFWRNSLIMASEQENYDKVLRITFAFCYPAKLLFYEK